ncbi:MAG TPA: hypothetical protein VMB21_04645 [Candidatus Limnocylindria bacterium]|nr:hypothetical protein [Candidatus Limnocylindria bacterium]
MDKLPRIPSPSGTVWREFRVTAMPIIAFIVVLILAILLWRSYVGPSAIVGEVETVRSIIASTQPGHLTQMKVTLLQRVKAGDPLVQVLPADPKVVAARLSLSRTRIGFLRDSIDSKVRQQNNRINYASLRINWLSEKVQLAGVRARTNYLAGELERSRRSYLGLGTNLLTSQIETNAIGFGSFASFQSAEANLAQAEAEIAERTRLVEDIERIMTQMSPEEAKLDEEFPSAIRTAIAVEEQELHLLELELAPVTFTAPMDAFVSSITHREGENVTAGEPIMVLSAINSERIIAYLRQPMTTEPHVDQAVEIRARSHRRDLAQGRILSVGGQMETILPELLPAKPVNGAPEFGLPILVSLPPGFKVLPGEIVDLMPLD